MARLSGKGDVRTTRIYEYPTVKMVDEAVLFIDEHEQLSCWCHYPLLHPPPRPAPPCSILQMSGTLTGLLRLY